MRALRTYPLWLLTALLWLLSSGLTTGSAQWDLSVEHQPREILYGFRGPARAVDRQQAVRVTAAVQEQELVPGRIYRLVLPDGANLERAMLELQALPAVRFVEPNYLVQLDQVVPNDPLLSMQWALNSSGSAGIDAPAAWALRTRADDVIVAVIDSGIDYLHPDLDENLWQNAGEVPGNGIDDDGNGWIDDVYGIDAFNGDGDPMDVAGHGTHVAGIIGAESDNGLDVAGTCWRAQMMALKFIESRTGPTSGAIACIQYAVEHGAQVINASWGSYGRSEALEAVIEWAGASGVLFCAAAGNASENSDARPTYPSGFSSPYIVSIASSDSEDRLSTFSNFGSASVDLAAPGSSIVSTYLHGGAASLSGTSMATPFVAGTAALLFAQSGTSDPLEVRDWILRSVDVLPQWNGVVATGGRLNLYRALLAAEDRGGNRSPHADAGPDLESAADTLLTFDGRESFDPEGASLQYRWDFGDGSAIEYGEVVHHSFDVAGTYVVTLTVDDGVSEDRDTSVVRVLDLPFPGQGLLLSSTKDIVLDGMTVDRRDLVHWDPIGQLWTMVFDASDVLPDAALVRAAALRGDGSLIVAFADDSTRIPGLVGGPRGEFVDDEDLVRFVPASWGDVTLGSWEFLFDGSDVGLGGKGEEIRGVSVGADGALYLSFQGRTNVGGILARNEDILRFEPEHLGRETVGRWSLLFDGSSAQVKLNSPGEQLSALHVHADGTILLSTAKRCRVPGVRARNEDVLLFVPSRLGSPSEGVFHLLFDGSEAGMADVGVDSIIGLDAQYLESWTEAPPAAPTNLQVANLWETRLDLNWIDESDDELAFVVEMSEDGIEFFEEMRVTSDDRSARIDELTPETTYWFRVRSFGLGGYSEPSNTVQVTTKSKRPEAPTDLQVTNLWETRLDLRWTDHSSKEDGFAIEQSNDGSTFFEVGRTGTDDTTFRVQDLIPETTYWFRVHAYNQHGDSDDSNTIQVTTKSGRPAPPTGLQAPNIWATKVDLSWTDNSSDETGFSIERSENGTNFGEVGTTAADDHTFRNVGLDPETAYWFRVRAFNQYGYSDYSNTIVVTTKSGRPAAPSGLQAPNIWATKVDLSWTDNSSDETGFSIERSENGTNFGEVGTTVADDHSFRNVGLNPETAYWFRVRAFNEYGYSEYSNTILITTKSDLPNPPSGLQTTDIWETRLDLKWTDNSNNESGFAIELSTNGSSYSEVGRTDANDVTFRVQDLEAETSYWFRVRAYNSAGYSAYSNTILISTKAKSPVNLRTSNVWATKIDLKWDDRSRAEAGFSIEMSTNGTSFSEIGTTVTDDTTFRVTGLKASTTYWFRVRAFNANGYSGYSNTLEVTTKSG